MSQDKCSAPAPASAPAFAVLFVVDALDDNGCHDDQDDRSADEGGRVHTAFSFLSCARRRYGAD